MVGDSNGSGRVLTPPGATCTSEYRLTSRSVRPRTTQFGGGGVGYRDSDPAPTCGMSAHPFIVSVLGVWSPSRWRTWRARGLSRGPDRCAGSDLDSHSGC